MPVLLSLLATGCQTRSRLTQSQQAAATAAVALLISLHWRSSSKRGLGALAEDAAWKWAQGHREQIFPDSRVLLVTSTVTEQIWDDSEKTCEAFTWKETERDPIGCLYVSGRLMLACYQSLTVMTKCVSLCMYAGVSPSPESALSHTQISVWVKAASLPDSLHCRAFLFAHCFLIDSIVDYTHLIQS